MTKPLRHLGIIMDGNGRWASSRGRARTFGHIKGARVAKKVITSCRRRGVKYLTLYAFSTENWYRPNSEVVFLMDLLRRYLKREVENLVKENIRLQFIGEVERLPRDLQAAMASALESTKSCTGMTLIFAISYGSRSEIVSATKRIAEKVLEGTINPSDVNEDLLASHLETFPAPDPDLIIRTSGESRLSNFLLWQAAYSEFYFTDILWPDFTEEALDRALRNFANRQRRFGGTETRDEQIRP